MKPLYLPLFFLAASITASITAFSQVAFVSDRRGELDIFVFDDDTSSVRQISDTEAAEYGLVWSRDGRYLYFVSYGDGDQNIWRIRPDGTGRERVTSGPYARNINDIAPGDRSMLVNTKKDNPKGDTYILDTDGGDGKRITDNDFSEAGAAFSPDGKTIALSIQVSPDTTGTGAGNAELFLLDTAGTKIRRLTNSDSTFDALPAFSPDGKFLAYHSCIGGHCAIRVLDMATGVSRSLPTGDPDSRWPRWSRDGKWIAYTRVENGETDIWIIKPDGTGNRPYIVSPGRDEIAVFGPKPVKLPD